MTALTELQAMINQEIDRLTFPEEPAELYEPISYILRIGGKRMRPAMLLIACELFGGDLRKAIRPAIGVEVFHNFTLMHDDIMDKAPLRRGMQTVHERWNSNVAILSGDVMLVESYKLMMETEEYLLRPILDVFNATAIGVCQGQQMDMDFEQLSGVGIARYIEMVRLKTAVLLGAALRIGALIGGAAAQDAVLLQNFGEQLGITFQLQDDLLDVYGDPGKFGKKTGGDILANKKTFLLIKALELASPVQKEELQHWLSGANFPEAEKIAAVTAVYDALEVRELTLSAIRQYTSRAFGSLEAVTLSNGNRSFLRHFAEGLMLREH